VIEFRLLEAEEPGIPEGEVYSCAYSPDGKMVLSAGWDGNLRLWDTTTGRQMLYFHTNQKALSACNCSPDGFRWYSGSMDGLFTIWDAVSQRPKSSFLAHTRPISSISLSHDGKKIATTSWDRRVILRSTSNEQDGHPLGVHHDVVSGCTFTTDDRHLISWSHDGTIKIWNVVKGGEVGTLVGHRDRVTSLGVSPDGIHAISGGSDHTLRLWNVVTHSELATATLSAEVRICFFLLDAETVLVGDAKGHLMLLRIPNFECLCEARMPHRFLSGSLAPSSMQVALGCNNGRINFVQILGMEDCPLSVIATAHRREDKSLLGKVLGTYRSKAYFRFTCPVCNANYENPTLPPSPFTCSQCGRFLNLRTDQPHPRIT